MALSRFWLALFCVTWCALTAACTTTPEGEDDAEAVIHPARQVYWNGLSKLWSIDQDGYQVAETFLVGDIGSGPAEDVIQGLRDQIVEIERDLNSVIEKDDQVAQSTTLSLFNDSSQNENRTHLKFAIEKSNALLDYQLARVRRDARRDQLFRTVYQITQAQLLFLNQEYDRYISSEPTIVFDEIELRSPQADLFELRKNANRLVPVLHEIEALMDGVSGMPATEIVVFHLSEIRDDQMEILERVRANSENFFQFYARN